MKVLVLGGGDSPERDVSIRSAAAVTKALRAAGFEVIEQDPQAGFEAPPNQADLVIFPILHGRGGEDGSIQKLLEEHLLPYLGTDSKASTKSWDKWQTRQVLEAAGLPMAEGYLVNRDNYHSSPLINEPHVLKVTKGGSTIGTYIVHDPAELDQAKVDEVFSYGDEAVIERLVEGVEITVPVLDDQALPVIEIRPPEGKEFDYENKYNGSTQEIVPAVSIDEATQQRAQELAVAADKAIGCRHLSRTDMIVRPDGSIAILEINTMPGMTDQSLFPKAAAAAGMDMPALMKRFIELVKRDHQLSEV